MSLDTGSVASSTIIIGIPLEKVDELVREAKRPLEDLTVQQRENIALLKEKLDLNETIREVLTLVGDEARAHWGGEAVRRLTGHACGCVVDLIRART